MQAIPWYKSNIAVGIAVSLLCKALVLSGLVANVATEDLEAASQTVVSLIGGMGDLWALVSRLRQEQAPKVVGTAKTAALHNEPQQITEAIIYPSPAVLERIEDTLDEVEVPSWMFRA
jgi:hypothetical protein